MAKQNCIILHGCPDDIERAMDPQRRSYDKHWIPWTKAQLERRGIPTATPLMPNPWTPDYEAYKKEFAKLVVTENTILIGHSCGSAFLVRWLGETQHKVAKLILVAPWKIAPLKDPARKAFYEYPIDPTVRENVRAVVIFTADDEEPEGKESARIFHEAMGGKIISLPNHGHYTQSDMGKVELPELLEQLV